MLLHLLKSEKPALNYGQFLSAHDRVIGNNCKKLTIRKWVIPQIYREKALVTDLGLKTVACSSTSTVSYTHLVCLTKLLIY